MSDPVVQVVWKDEGDFGIIQAVRQSDVDWREANPNRIGIPYDPTRVAAYGTLAEAEELAREHGVTVVQT